MPASIEQPDSLTPPAAIRSPTRRAEITPVPRNQAGSVLNALNVWIAAGLTLLPIPVGLIGGIGGLGLAVYLYGKSPAVAGLYALVGFTCGAASVVTLVCFQQVLASRFLRWRAAQSFEARVDSLVRPDDPEAAFVDFLPRGHWGQNMLEPATDMGFFKIDHSRRELLLEGDLKRYRIPFDSVATCQVEDYALGREQWEADRHFVTVITVDTETGPREIPLAGRHLTFTSRRAAERRAQAEDLCTRILMALNA